MSELKRAPFGTVRELKRPVYIPEDAWERSLNGWEVLEEMLCEGEEATYQQRWAYIEGYALGWRDCDSEKCK
jgi:hypothetical protein